MAAAVPSLQEMMLREGYSKKLDPTNTTFPFDVDILIIEKAKLRVVRFLKSLIEDSLF